MGVPAPGFALLTSNILCGAEGPEDGLLTTRVLHGEHILCRVLEAGRPFLTPAAGPTSNWCAAGHFCTAAGGCFWRQHAHDYTHRVVPYNAQLIFFSDGAVPCPLHSRHVEQLRELGSSPGCTILIVPILPPSGSPALGALLLEFPTGEAASAE